MAKLSNVIPFIPKGSKTAKENLSEFIRLCKEDLTVFGGDLVFSLNKWDISDTLSFKGRKNISLNIVFGHQNTAYRKGDDFTPFKTNLLDFCKAYMRYMHAMRPTKNFITRLIAFRALDIVLENKEIYEMQAIDLNNAINWISQNYSAGLAYRIGGQLDMLHKFLVEKQLISNKFAWTNYLKRPSDTQRIGKEADELRVKKLPSKAALDAIPEIFRSATVKKDIIVSSVLAIICSSPDRISEVMELPFDCEVFQKDRDGNTKYGLRWWPAKNASPQIKWIIPSMSEVVQEAMAKIKRESQEARKIAVWYEKNPNKLFLPDDLEYLRGKADLDSKDIARIVGISSKGSTSSAWLIKTYKIPKTIIKKRVFVSFNDLEKVMLQLIPSGFPYFDIARKFKYSDLLFLVRKNELKEKKGTFLCMFEWIPSGFIQGMLGGKAKFGNFYSIFKANGYTEPDGSEISVTTHQFRHYLNTLAQAGGMSQLDIAKWSGRKDVSQNRAYDHVTSTEIVQIIRNAVGNQDKSIGPLAHLRGKDLIPRDEFARLIVPTAHVTDIGYCIHDYTMSPCEEYRDCINCQEMVCIKGDKKAEKNIKMALDDSSRLLEQAKTASKDGYYGADRWLESHEKNHERYSQLVEILNNPQVPDGTVIQLAKGKKSIKKPDAKLAKLTNDE